VAHRAGDRRIARQAPIEEESTAEFGSPFGEGALQRGQAERCCNRHEGRVIRRAVTLDTL
jgi:hypothetical protein